MNNSQNNSPQETSSLEETVLDDNIILEELHKADEKNRSLAVNANGKTKYKKIKPDKKSKGSSRSKKRRKKIICRILIGLLILIVLAIVGIIIAYNVTRDLGKKELLKHNEDVSVNVIEEAHSDDDGKTITYKGKTYRFNEDLVSIVIMGVDKSELNTEVYGDAGQADAIYIFTYDTNTGKCCLLPISRETMTDVRRYSTSGKDIGLKKMQLCLSYAYGDGKESSCTNTLESLSRILYNIPFNAYVSLNWDSIGPLNDVLGGVTLKALQNIPSIPALQEGEDYTLMGEDALSYIQYRDTSKLESNPDRLRRQRQYINAYVSKLIPVAQNDIGIVADLYDTATDYMCTNISRNELVYIASEILPNVYSAKDINYITIEGKTKQGEEYAEFYPDETSLYEAILKVFYVKDVD